MQKVTRNQLGNVDNISQHPEKYKRVLCVCSAGMLRSATAARVLAEKFNFNTRSVGTEDYALVPVTELLLVWADEVVCMEKRHKNRIMDELRRDFPNNITYVEKLEAKMKVLNIPDDFEYMNEELQTMILKAYSNLKY